jgi:hypothetical protein
MIQDRIIIRMFTHMHTCTHVPGQTRSLIHACRSSLRVDAGVSAEEDLRSDMRLDSAREEEEEEE